jgi:hypothetical protein
VAAKTSRKNKSEPVLTDEHESTENRRLACRGNRYWHTPRAKMHSRITPEPGAKTDQETSRKSAVHA